MSHFKDYKFFRSFSAKVEGWPLRKAEQLWRRLRERKIAGTGFDPARLLSFEQWIDLGLFNDSFFFWIGGVE